MLKQLYRHVFAFSILGITSNSTFVSMVALAQYSGDPRTEWQLNSHPTKKSLMDAVANLPYKGGNTLTGKLYYCLIWQQHL